MSDPRLLLLEFLNNDRHCQYRSDNYPFIRGWTEAEGIPTRWLATGFESDLLPSGPFKIALPKAEEREFIEMIWEFAPTHILMNEELDDQLNSIVASVAGEAELLCVVDVNGGANFELVENLAAWIYGGEIQDLAASPTETSYLVDVAYPLYECSLLGQLAHEICPFVHVVGDQQCCYAGSIRRNPMYDGIDLSQANRTTGCAFCSVDENKRSKYKTSAVDLAVRQVRAALLTVPPERGRGEFVIMGARVFLRLGEFFEAILAEALPASAFFFTCCVDELWKQSSIIDELMPRLEAAGHSINLHNISVENFSPVENQRLNKGISLDVLTWSFEKIVGWERDYPNRFFFHAHGGFGFGFILFTPWTRLNDLEINLEHAELFQIPRSSFFHTSRLRLQPNHPITLLAERDGLLEDKFRDSAVGVFGDSGVSINLEDCELAWRFRHTEVAAIYHVIIRTEMSKDIPAEDPLFCLIQERLSALPSRYRAPGGLMPELVAEARSTPAIVNAEELLDRVHKRLLAANEGRGDPGEVMELPNQGDSDVVVMKPTTPVVRYQSPLAKRMHKALMRVDSGELDLWSFQVDEFTESIDADSGGVELTVALRRDEEELVIHLLPRAESRRCFLNGKQVGLRFGKHTPIDTPDKNRVARRLLLLADHLAIKLERGSS